MIVDSLFGLRKEGPLIVPLFGSQTRIPMKSRLTTAIRSSRLTEQSLYIPQEREKGVLYVPVEPEMVKVISVRGTEALADSSLYKLYRSIE